MTEPFGNLDRLPGSPQLHRWADWAELLCLSLGELGVPDLAEEVGRREDSLHAELDDDIEPDSRVRDDLLNPFDSPDQFSDAVSRRAHDTFGVIATRASAYGDAYPFNLDAANRRISLREARKDRLMYLFLLTCASLRYVPSKRDQTIFAGAFEWLSLEALRFQSPAHAEVHLFGANPTSTGRYDMPLAARIRQLSTDIREPARVDLDKEFPPPGAGDNGLDLVSWLPMQDEAPGLFTVFGQCACTPKWVEKQHSSSADAWEQIFGFTVRPTNVCAIPYDFRSLDGDWYARHSLHGALLLDRRRMMSTIGKLDASGAFAHLRPEVEALVPLASLSDLLMSRSAVV